MGEKQPNTSLRQRIDKWLFFTRMAKSRSLAQTLIEAGKVRVNGDPVRQSSFQVKPGDRIELSQDRQDKVLIAVLPGERRGPYEEARTLYEDHSPPPPDKSTMSPFDIATREPGSGRPVKKERRALDRLTQDRWNDE